MKFLCTEDYYPPHVVVGICGLKQGGKTLFALEQGYAIVKEVGGSILYLNTEEPTSFFIDTWKEAMEKKYGVKPEIVYKYCQPPEIGKEVDIMKLVGFGGILRNSNVEKAQPKKAQTQKKEEAKEGEQKEEEKQDPTKEKAVRLDFNATSINPTDSELAKLIKEKNIGYIVVDSVTAAFDPIATAGRQNFPTRANMEELFLSYLPLITFKSGKPIYIMTIHHLSYNPTDPFAEKMQEKLFVQKGGKEIGHFTKVLYGLDKYLRPHGARDLLLIRYPNQSEFSRTYTLLISESGFSKVDPKDLEKIKAEQKAAKA